MIDKGKCKIMAHVLLRDPDTNETILRRRDGQAVAEPEGERQGDAEEGKPAHE